MSSRKFTALVVVIDVMAAAYCVVVFLFIRSH